MKLAGRTDNTMGKRKIAKGQTTIYFNIHIQLKGRVTRARLKTWGELRYSGRVGSSICVTNGHGYIPLVESKFRSFPHLWLSIRFVTRLARQVPLAEQELPTLPEYLSSPQVFSRARVTRPFSCMRM
jgi:hypothetical protein